MDTRIYLEMIHQAEKLKDEIRHSTTSSGKAESVAEHSWRIALMAMWLKDEFRDADIDKVIKMCLIHDLGECFTGDIPVFLKTKADEEKEEQSLDNWLREIDEACGQEMKELYWEMKEMKTLEARIYKALDKLEAVIQHNDAPIETWEDHEYDLQKEYAHDVVSFSDFFKRLRADILAETNNKINIKPAK